MLAISEQNTDLMQVHQVQNKKPYSYSLICSGGYFSDFRKTFTISSSLV